MNFVKKVKALFERIDRDVESFQKKTGLGCQSGCGRCCHSPKVETTVLEMYPLVEQLIESGQMEQWYDRAKTVSFTGPCVFYKPDPLDPDKGRCTVYAFRPAICRLFGFSARKNKRDQHELITCSVIKGKEGRRINDIQDRINRGLKVPVMQDYSARVYQLHPVLGCRQMTINLAFRKAAEGMGLQSQIKREAKPPQKS
jgi:Fe-S-cluster containining protein